MYVISITKNCHFLVMMMNEKNVFEKILEILKKVCILKNFSEDYAVGEFLGAGHFAKVHLVTNKITKQKFAAKILSKTTENFNKEKVLYTII